MLSDYVQRMWGARRTFNSDISRNSFSLLIHSFIYILTLKGARKNQHDGNFFDAALRWSAELSFIHFITYNFRGGS